MQIKTKSFKMKKYCLQTKKIKIISKIQNKHMFMMINQKYILRHSH